MTSTNRKVRLSTLQSNARCSGLYGLKVNIAYTKPVVGNNSFNTEGIGPIRLSPYPFYEASLCTSKALAIRGHTVLHQGPRKKIKDVPAVWVVKSLVNNRLRG